MLAWKNQLCVLGHNSMEGCLLLYVYHMRKTKRLVENCQTVNFPSEHRIVIGQLLELFWILGEC